MKTHRVEFDGSAGTLAARLDQPDASVHGYALFAHCFTCGKDMIAAQRISRALANQGIATMRFDFTGLGHSEGEWENTNFSSNVNDLIHAAEFLREAYEPPKLLVGHSLGGAAVLSAASFVPEAVGVVTIGAPYDPAHVQHLFKEQLCEIETQGIADVDLAGRVFTVKKQFLDDISSQNLKEKIATLHKALLVFHAPLDQTVSIDNAAEIFMAARHPKSFVSLDGADHLVTQADDAEYIAEMIAAWSKRYL